jgi:hypothetical protein
VGALLLKAPIPVKERLESFTADVGDCDSIEKPNTCVSSHFIGKEY